MVGRRNALSSEAIVLSAFLVLYVAAALLCLVQWNPWNRWRQVDIFSAGYLVLSTTLAAWQFRFFLRAPEAARQEMFGFTYDPGWSTFSFALGAGEMLAFIDYGHLHLAPALRQPALQAAGMTIYLFAIGWLAWVDRHLGAHFAGNLASRRVMQEGPYRYIRHPRYAGLVATRIAMPLLLASVIGWGLTLGWILLIRRRIRLEEQHLFDMFGDDYRTYSHSRARLLPGIY
ncbi:MAG: methyltransferase family protein [Blastocatellia bacterium]